MNPQYATILSGVVQGLLSNPELNYVFPSASRGGGPPQLNGYALGAYGEEQEKADVALSKIAHKIARTLYQEGERIARKEGYHAR